VGQGAAGLMRVGWKCVPIGQGDGRDVIDANPAEFAETMGYGTRRYESRTDFFAFHSGTWVLELRVALAELLDRHRSVLSLGSGECEHEVPFVLQGYDILASDVVDTGTSTRLLFPELHFQVFDILNPHPIGTFDDVLITGLDFYFADDEFSRVIGNVRALLRPGGRMLLTLRYRDNAATWLIDRVGIPAICTLARVAGMTGLTRRRWALKRHGYRRSMQEIRLMAERHGFRIGRVRHAGFGVELSRVYVDRIPQLYSLLREVDRRLHVFNNAIVFECLL